MPRRQTRHDIERELDAWPSRVRVGNGQPDMAVLVRIQAQLKRLRASVDPARFARMEEAIRLEIRKLGRRRRPGEGSMPALVEPPRGPKPLAGGAAAPLEFD
jgi:hypothetical protein